MRRWCFALLLGAAALLRAVPGSAETLPIDDAAAVPFLPAAGRGLYRSFLLADTPRVFALSVNGHAGWADGGTLDIARTRALETCAKFGGTDCHPYAENLSIVWPGREWQPPPVPPPFVDGFNYSIEPDKRFLWHGPAAASGVLVWAHGHADNADSRGLQPPPFVRAFNDAGFDIVRFDRVTQVDTTARARGWLADELPALRRRGYRVVIAAGQSRGGWNALQMLDSRGLADVVIATSPAAHGSGGSMNLGAQDDDLRAIVAAAPPSQTRVAVVQFTNDPFMSDADTRRRILSALRGKTGGLLLIDRPEGFSGHGGAGSDAFARRYAACLLRFATAPQPLAACPATPG